MKNRLDYREFLEVENTRKRLRKLLSNDRVSPEFRHELTRRLEDTRAAADRLKHRVDHSAEHSYHKPAVPAYQAAYLKKSTDLRPGLLSRAVNQVKNFFRRQPK